MEALVVEFPEAGFSVGEKVQTQTELSSVSGNTFPSGNELLVFQSELRNRLGGTED
jgi:hypothetical protein